MEGYLLKKSSDRGLGSGWLTDKNKSWNRRWFVLEDQTVTYYEDFDLVSGEPVREKGKILINGCEVLPVSHKTKKFVFCVKDGKNNLLYVQAEDAKMLGIWIRAMAAAASGENKAPALDYHLYYRRLRLDPLVEYEPSAINRAFRTLAAYSSPENGGGNPKEFKELQEAFNHIMAQLNDREEARLYRLAYYEAVIIKGGPGEGMGIVVQEEADRRNLVKAVKETLRIKSITGEVGEDGIQEGDQLIKIGSKDVSTMPLVRVAQRMNDFRIPPNAMVKITFGRKVPREYVLDGEYGVESGFQQGMEYAQGEGEGNEAQPQQQEYYTDEEVEEVQGPAQPTEPEYTRAQEPQQHQLRRENSNSANATSTAGFRAPLDSPGSYVTRESQQQRQLSGGSVQFAEPDVDNGRAQNVQPSFSGGNTSGGQGGQAAARPSNASFRGGSAAPPPVQVPQYESVSPLSSPGGQSQWQSQGSPSARPASLPLNASGRTPPLSRQSSYTPASAPLAASGRPSASTRHGSIATSPVTQPQAAASPTVAGAPQALQGAARPLSAKVEAIHTKEYFYRNSMQMKSPAEIAEMKRDLDFCLKEMQVASKRIEDLEFHNAQLEDELSRYKVLYTDSARHERLLETQLEQYLIHSTVTAEFMEESMNDMISVSEQISANMPIPVSDRTNMYLEEMGLGEDESELDGSKASQRNAIAATAAMDRSGLMLQKWAMTGDSIMDKLSRFEERVQRMDSIHVTNAPPGSGPSAASPQRQPSFQQVHGQQQQIQGNMNSYKQPQQYRQGNSTSPLRRSSSMAAPVVSPGSGVRRGAAGPSSPSAPGPGGNRPIQSPTKASTDPQAAQLYRINSQLAGNSAQQVQTSPAGRAPLSRTASMSAGTATYNASPATQQQQPQQQQQPVVDRLLAKSYSMKR